MTTNGHSSGDGITGEVLGTAVDQIQQLMAQHLYGDFLTADQWEQIGRMAKIAGGAESTKEPLLYDWRWRNLGTFAEIPAAVRIARTPSSHGYLTT